jgi:mono/diheme cytochrome c family protein
LTNPLDNTIANLDEGKAIFIRECMICHGDAGRGNGLYGTEIQPGPPDFGDGSYGDYTDADYFWRISEGVPWTAMPSWKIEYSEVDRWKLVHYIRTIFTQTEDGPALPADGQNFTYPEFYQTSMTLPEDASYERGKIVFITQCAHCHGAAGDGQGVDGQYLNPTPADFRTLANLQVTPQTEGAYISKITFGIQGTAMPKWGEFLTLADRWDALKFVFDTFTGSGMSVGDSVYTDQIPVNFLTLSSDVYVSEGYTITPSDGEPLFATYCATCHGESGEGMGPGTEGGASSGPGAFPSDLGETYLFWRIWEGVPGSPMAPYQWVLNHGDVWNLTTFLVNLTSSTQGGQP